MDEYAEESSKYGLVGILVSAGHVWGRSFSPRIPSGTDDGRGAGEMLDDPVLEEGHEMADDEAEDLSAAERG